MEKKIVYIRLLSGEELIATHFRTSETTFGFEKVIQLHIGPPQPPSSHPTIGFGAWLPYTKAMEKVDININSIVLMSDPIEPLRLEYLKLTGQIITPEKKGFILPT